jgi:outer membrane protein TolC
MLQAMVMRMPNGMILTSGPRSTEMIQQSVAGMAMQKTDWMYSIMASITLPFAPWSSGRSTAKADEMRSTNLSIEAEKNAMQREMIASLRSALNRYSTDDSLVHQYQAEILPLTHQSAEAQTVAYQTGQVPITTVLDSRRMELMKQDDYLMVIMDRQMAFVEIEMMVGAPLQ